MDQIPLFQPNLPPVVDVLGRLKDVLESGYVAEGETVADFESALGEYLGCSNVATVNSGTAALHIALRLCGVGPGDEVISTPATALPTNMSILMAGGRVKWADVDPATGNIDPQSLQSQISERTKAIMVVDYGGYPVDLDAIGRIGADYGVPVIEDAAHAFGAEWQGKRIGCHSDLVCFSFQAIKLLTTGDGGALVCKRESDLHRAKLIRWFGIDKGRNRMDPNSGFDVDEVGFKYHMNNLSAAIGLEQMKYVEKRLAAYREVAQFYDQHLRGVSGLELCSPLPGSRPAYWLYTIKVERREQFVEKLAAHGIAASVVHPRNDTYKVFRESIADLPGVDAFYKQMVHIPIGPWVGQEQRERIVGVISGGW